MLSALVAVSNVCNEFDVLESYFLILSGKCSAASSIKLDAPFYKYDESRKAVNSTMLSAPKFRSYDVNNYATLGKHTYEHSILINQ